MVLKPMWWLLYFNIFSLICCCFAEDIKEIEFPISSEWTNNGIVRICDNKLIEIEADEQFRVYVDNNGEYVHNTSRCHSSYISENKIYSVDLNSWIHLRRASGRAGFVSGPLDISAQLGEWNCQCTFYTSPCEYFSLEMDCFYKPYETTGITNDYHKDLGINCVATVRIKPKQTVPFHLSVNSERFNETQEKRMHEFMFYEEEGVEFNCLKTISSTAGNLMLNFIAKDNKPRSTHFLDTASVSMYKKLRAENDGDIVDCGFRQGSAPRYIRVKLVARKDDTGILAYSVNGLILPRVEEPAGVYNYEYKYYYGESVAVSLRYGDIYEETSCSSNKNTQLHYVESSINQLNLATFDLHYEGVLECTVKRKTDLKLICMRLKFSFNLPEYSPTIGGLPMSNVLLQYSNSMSNMIEYEIGNEALQLYCYGYFNTHKHYIDAWHFSYEVVPTIKNNQRNFQLRDGYNSSTIECKDENAGHSTHLTLVRRKDLVTTSYPMGAPEITIPHHTIYPPGTIATSSTTKSTPSTTVTASTNTDTTAPPEGTTESQISPPSFPEGAIWGIVLIMVLIILLIAYGMWVVVKTKKRRMLENKSLTEAYDNLPEHHEDPMPIPSQWNRPNNIYTGTNSTKNQMGRIHKSNKKTSATKTTDPNSKSKDLNQPTYSIYLNFQETNDELSSVNNEEPTYLQTPNTLEEDIYTEVSNKTHDTGKTNEILENKHSNDLVYADIYHKNGVNTDFKVSEKAIYCEVVPQNTYENLCKGQDHEHIYANEDVNNEVEPAYSVIVKPKI